jgi:C1A family cysteine protease
MKESIVEKPLKRIGKIRKIAFIAAFALAVSPVFAQLGRNGTGAILDEAIYSRVPQKAVQLSRLYENLPARVSLKSYSPYPGNQGVYGTCTAWASAYAARTITESIALNRKDRFLTTNSVFSPAHIYKNISSDPECRTGTYISAALDYMRDSGNVKMLPSEKTTAFPAISLTIFAGKKTYRIAGYTRLYMGTASDQADRVLAVKKSLSENKPVIIGINCPNSFDQAKDVWNPPESPAVNYGGHALVVIGYDDSKYGGAFEIQNSWGESWGNNGYIWMPYNVFGQFANQAYELIENLAAYETASEFAGFAEIQVAGSNAGMPVVFKDGYYETINDYASGTRFRYLLGNAQPAYVYAFAADNTASPTTTIFPADGVSPALDYKENVIAFPGEFTWIQLDAVAGTDYLVILYSKQALDIQAIRRRFEQNKSGGFFERVASAVGADFIDYRGAHYEKNEKDEIRFKAQSPNKNAVFGLLLAIKHQ